MMVYFMRMRGTAPDSANGLAPGYYKTAAANGLAVVVALF
jgi:hypothetical protein